jgi:phosphate transport system substrate-binding protein
MMKRILIVAALAVPAVGGLFGFPCWADTSAKLVVTGSSTVAPLIAEIAKRFEQQNVGVRVDVQTGGSSRGIADAKTGVADIGMSSRNLNPEEAAELKEWVLAKDGICFLVHKDNPMKALTNDQINAIYTGAIGNWKQIGGPDRPLVAINRADGRAELEQFSAFFKLNPEDIKADLIAGENQQGIKLVAGNPDALVYMSIGASEYDAARGVPIKLLPMNGVEASSKTVADGTFPLSRSLVLVTKPQPGNPLARPFVDFALSAEVNDLILALSFVPVR